MIFKMFYGIIILSIALSGLNADAGVKPVLSKNAAAGMKIFISQKLLKNGGAACISCHSVTSINIMGGTLGPNLSGVYKQIGENGLKFVLKSVPFPTMKPIYRTRPITKQERNDLLAFLKYSSKVNQSKGAGKINRSRGKGLGLLISGVSIFVVLMILLPIIWKNRLFTVRRSLVEKL